MAYRPIGERLTAIQTALDFITNNADVSAALDPFGYNATKIAEGQTVLDEAQTLHNQQQVEYGEQYAATQAVADARKAAEDAYTNSLKLARMVFKDDVAAQTALLLGGRRKVTLSGLINQMTTFYDNLLANGDWQTAIAPFNRPLATLQEEQALVHALVDANTAQEKEKGEAQVATRDRDAKLDELFDWHSDLVTVAAVALEGNPEWIEAIRAGEVV